MEIRNIKLFFRDREGDAPERSVFLALWHVKDGMALLVTVEDLKCT